MAQCLLFSKEMFVWVDETGSDKRDQIRKCGYALKGQRASSRRLLFRGQRINVIAAMSSSEVIATEMSKSTVDGCNFFDFLRGTIIPNMMPLPNPRSVLILDNCSVHHITEVKDLLRQLGIVFLPLPPYSPDFNPLEEVFSYVKAYLRKHEELLDSIADPSDVITAALDSLTPSHCDAYVTHAGYD